MKDILISLAVAFLVAVVAYLAIPDQIYVEKAFNIIVFSFAGAGVVTWLAIRTRARKR